MQPSNATHTNPLAGRIVVITRPAGTASSVARQVRARGGVPLSLPGLSLRAADNAAEMKAALGEALRDELLVFTSPAAVRFAARLRPLRTKAMVFAVGQGTARALRRHGITALAPEDRQDSEGLLDQAALADVRGKRVALIGAPGGRGVLRQQLAARGARLRELHVYRRVAPRLSQRHVDAVTALPTSALVLLSSAEALAHLQAQLPPAAWARFCAATALVSSPRLAEAARAADFRRIRIAASAVAADLLAAAPK